MPEAIVRVASVHAAGLYVLVVLVPHPLHYNFGVAPALFILHKKIRETILKSPQNFFAYSWQKVSVLL